MFKKPSTPRSETYLEFIRNQPCLVTSHMAIDGCQRIVAHHVRIGQGGGVGLKPSDYRCLPLADAEHMKLHNMGEKSYWAKHGIDCEQEICRYLLLYLNYKFEAKRDIDYRSFKEALEEAAKWIDSEG